MQHTQWTDSCGQFIRQGFLRTSKKGLLYKGTKDGTIPRAKHGAKHGTTILKPLLKPLLILSLIPTKSLHRKNFFDATFGLNSFENLNYYLKLK